MINLILIFIIGLIKSLADTIRVPERFNSSILSKYKNNLFIDPQVSYINGEQIPNIFYPILIHFSDLWHLCNSIIISLFLIMMFTFNFPNIMYNPGLEYLLIFIMYWCIYGIGMELGLKILIKSK